MILGVVPLLLYTEPDRRERNGKKEGHLLPLSSVRKAVQVLNAQQSANDHLLFQWARDQVIADADIVRMFVAGEALHLVGFGRTDTAFAS